MLANTYLYFFLIRVILVGGMVSHYAFNLNFPNTDYIEYLFCVYWPFTCLLEKKLFKSLAHFQTGLFIFLLLSCVLYIFWIQVPYQIYDFQIFSPILWVVSLLFLTLFLLLILLQLSPFSSLCLCPPTTPSFPSGHPPTALCVYGSRIYAFWLVSHLLSSNLHSPLLSLPCWWCLLKHKSFKFWWSPIYQSSLLSHVLVVLYLRNNSLTKGHEDLFTPMHSRIL